MADINGSPEGWDEKAAFEWLKKQNLKMEPSQSKFIPRWKAAYMKLKQIFPATITDKDLNSVGMKNDPFFTEKIKGGMINDLFSQKVFLFPMNEEYKSPGKNTDRNVLTKTGARICSSLYYDNKNWHYFLKNDEGGYTKENYDCDGDCSSMRFIGKKPKHAESKKLELL